ncbi:tumor necrosis factor receptor superfamily member 5 [Xyrichtys novacula]|uniref:Tumor necrosis factor receptor superfamily member 5 n=1 Tax=Xyrichtys novacula TaxID=13765 RepID=A0AAV1FNH7_XYRNO|nr:tumor necrosis factor receptor superfamily member 5 [Xyrichtys novacula]
MSCESKDKYSKDGRCCDRCPAGWSVQTECNETKKTECAECLHGTFTATKNHLSSCRPCKDCSSIKNGRKLKDCTAREDTVCACERGFYCSNEECEHCHRVKTCPPGEGVQFEATGTNDTKCAVCEKGTFSNVTDFYSPCKRHTRCDDRGRLLKTPGTLISDAVCGGFKTECHWITPAALWSGLVLTALILFGVLCWRSRRRSSRVASPDAPVAFIQIPTETDYQPELPLPSREQNGHYTEEVYKLPLFTPDDNTVSYATEDSMGSVPITPLQVSVSFAESSQDDKSAGHCTTNFFRTHSEPQEDEWCGAEAS